jgi:hypothetical protein
LSIEQKKEQLSVLAELWRHTSVYLEKNKHATQDDVNRLLAPYQESNGFGLCSMRPEYTFDAEISPAHPTFFSRYQLLTRACQLLEREIPEKTEH